MYLASAYPNSALSVLALMLLAFVMAGCLALWLGLVFLADRKSTEQEAREADSYLAVVAQPPATEDGQSGTGAGPADSWPGDSRPAGSQQGAAA
jgi:hypothetical protein